MIVLLVLNKAGHAAEMIAIYLVGALMCKAVGKRLKK